MIKTATFVAFTVALQPHPTAECIKRGDNNKCIDDRVSRINGCDCQHFYSSIYSLFFHVSPVTVRLAQNQKRLILKSPWPPYQLTSHMGQNYLSDVLCIWGTDFARRIHGTMRIAVPKSTFRVYFAIHSQCAVLTLAKPVTRLKISFCGEKCEHVLSSGLKSALANGSALAWELQITC